MASFPEILNAFEQALELERELGTRTVECDRALLAPGGARGARALPSAATSAAAPARTTDEQREGRACRDQSGALGERALPSAATSAAAPARTTDEQREGRACRDQSGALGERALPSAATSAALPTVAELTACTKCPLATLGRTHVVPGQGNANGPDFMFVGEAPGADEDRQGLAFVGAAGQFLTKMIAAMGYTREQVFIANICKCRPPNNRTPSPPEMAACVPYLKRQIKLVKPKCLILLGNTAMRGLFPDAPMRRGQWQMYEGIPAIGTFHPAYILRFDSARDPAGLRKAKLEVWNTLKFALARLGKTPPAIQKKG